MPDNKNTEFDYETAWSEAAEPAFRRLPAEVRALYELTCEVAKDLRQDSDCSMMWPEDNGEHRRRFDAFDDATLALASRVVHAWGNWASGAGRDQIGGTWKFSKYCDQVLASRLGVPRASKYSNGANYHVSEGQLRVSVDTPHSGVAGEPLPATREACAEARDALDGLTEPDRKANQRAWDKWEDAARLALKRVAARHTFPADFAALDASRFMVPEGTWRKRREDERRAKADAAAEPRFHAIVGAVKLMRVALGEDARAIDDTLFQFFLSLGTSGTFRDRVMREVGGRDLDELHKKVLDK